MARHLYLHNGVAYEGELAVYRDDEGAWVAQCVIDV